jgi:hypothetical protein
MDKLHIPEYPFKQREHDGKKQIWDAYRKKYVALTAEEWVRQNFIAYLVNSLKYPPGLIAIEKEISFNQMKKRFDIVVYGKNHVPAMLIECKAPAVNIGQDCVDQAGRYNLVLKVKYLVVTNGLTHYCFYIDFEKKDYSLLDHIPVYDSLK